MLVDQHVCCQKRRKHQSKFPLTVSQIRGFAWTIALRSHRAWQFSNTGPSRRWWDGFKRRYQDELALRKPDNLDRGRARMSKQEIIDGCYATMENVLVENDLINKPENIFNVDELGINMSLKKGKVVVTKGTTNAHSMEKGSKDHITIVV